MREILFKAKRKDNGEWVEGCIVIDQSRLNIFKYRIQPIESGVLYAPPIDPDTICQLTGLIDKNGYKIWEGDIVEIAGEDGYFACEWEEDTARFVLNGDGLVVDFDNYYGYACEIAGNIFDNPDLLEVE